MVPDIGEPEIFVAENAGILPVPLAPNPIVVFELVQVNVPPAGVVTKLVCPTRPPLHVTMFKGTVTIGVGLTVMENVLVAP